MHIWTVDDSETMERLIDAGVDGIFTDRIDTLEERAASPRSVDLRGLRMTGPRIESDGPASCRGRLGDVGLGVGVLERDRSRRFVFAPYLVRGVVGDARRRRRVDGRTPGWASRRRRPALLIALLAPVTGQRADAGGRRKRSLAIWTGLVVATMLGLFLVKNEPSYLWLGLVLLAAGSVFMEFA